MITLILKRFGAWIVAALSVAGALFIALKSAKSVGKADARADAAKEDAKRSEQIAIDEIKIARQTADEQMEKTKEAQNANDNINAISNNDVIDRLHNKWSRD